MERIILILLNIDKHEGRAYLYQQIYNELKQKILNREFNPHDQLPSKRMLAENIDVSINTITNAYEQLLAEGYIYTIERSGYYVEDITQFTVQTKETTDFPDDLKEYRQKEEGWLSLSHMTADISLFPFKEWLKCKKQAIKQHKQELTEIPHPQGPYIVRDSIAKLIALTRGVNCEPEQMVISAGTQPLLLQLMPILNENIHIAIEDPGYARIYSLLKRLNLHVTPTRLDQKGIDMKKIEDTKVNCLFVTPSHQFPTGKIMPISRRIELLNWAAKGSNRYIIEDDYDSEFKYKTDNIPSLQSLDHHQRVIYMGTFSKSLLPTFRISYMVLPVNILRKYRERYFDLMQYSNTLALFTLHYFIESGAYHRHIKRMNQQYERKRNCLIKYLKKKFKDSIMIDDIPAGLHFLATFKTNKSYADIEQKAQQKKLEIYSMRRFMLQHKYKHTNEIELVLGFANIHIEDIPEAVDRLYHVIFS